MKRFISTTTALAMLLGSGPGLPLLAQDFPQADIDGQIVLCLPNKKAECPEGAMCTIAKDPANCEKQAKKFLKEMAGGAQAATVEEPVVVEEAPAEEPVVVEEAPAEEPVVLEEAPAEEPVVVEEAPAEEPVVVEEAPAEEPVVVEEAPTEEPVVVEEAPAEEPVVVEETVVVDPALTEAAPAEAALDETAALAFEPFDVMVGDQAVLCLPDKAMECPEGALCTYATKEKNCEANAAKKVASLAPVEVVVPDEAEVEALGEIIGDPAATDPTTIEAVTQNEAVEGETPVLPSETETSPDAVVTETVLTEEDTRSSTQEFDEAPTEVEPGKKNGLSNLEIAGLAILGTLAIGAILDKDKEVVENTGDRVVVQDGNGDYSIYKDDDALLREPGTTVRTETFSDGSTRTVMVRENGSQVVTIRDATGRVLQRSSYNAQGVQTQLIDDLSPERPVDVDRLPKPARGTAIKDSTTLPEIRAELDSIERADYAHSFSLRQIREIRKVRDLAPTIDVNNVTFDSGSSAIKKSEAKKLQRLGRLMAKLIEQNPGEMFLIEGHTDAVGKGGYNLALSDRRAESVARALTEFYGVPAENLVVQGYGEKELKIDTQSDERQNRRAAVRIITPLLNLRQVRDDRTTAEASFVFGARYRAGGHRVR